MSAGPGQLRGRSSLGRTGVPRSLTSYPTPQERRLSSRSGLSEDSHPSTGTASPGEPEGLPAEEEEEEEEDEEEAGGLSPQEATPAAQEEAEEESYEEVSPIRR